MACELEQQSVDLAVANLSQAQAIQTAAALEKQQADWAVMAAQMQLAMSMMLLMNCLSGGAGFGIVPEVIKEVMSLSHHEKISKEKVSEMVERLRVSLAGK